MSELLEKLETELKPLIEANNLELDYINYVKRGKEFYLEIYVERDDDSVEFDEIVAISGILSNKLDELDLIKDSYYLDVSTSGAEKEIKDFSKFSRYINKYMKIKLKRALQGQNVIEGTLLNVKDDKLTMEYKIKTRSVKVEIELDNISKANLAVKL